MTMSSTEVIAIITPIITMMIVQTVIFLMKFAALRQSVLDIRSSHDKMQENVVYMDTFSQLEKRFSAMEHRCHLP